MRVLMLCARYLPFTGGTETHVHEVGTRLVARGHEVTVLTADPAGALPPRESVGGMEVIRLPAWPRGRDWCVAPGLFGHVTRGGWDVAHVQGYHTFFAPLGMAAALAGGVPFAVTFHSGGHSSRLRTAARGVQHRLLAPLVSRAARLIGVSEFEADLFSRRMGIPRERFTVIPNGARLPVPSGRMQRSEDAPLIVSLGRLERYKGHHRALAAFAHLRAALPSARLRILGEGPYEAELRRQVAALGLEEAVEIGSLPAADRAGMADLLHAAALVVLLSEYEAHPVAVMEALSLDVPVLVGDTSGFRELAARGLVRAMPLATTPEQTALAMAEQMGARGQGPQVALPDWDDCVDRLVPLYEEAARTRLPRGGTGSADARAVAG